ncbi:uncharacterized protein LOC6560735 [Drosophila grimshawi]|uniref:GH21225 n=1 Tax=Drosophila grimshawi TaxID=7222 RepID=B4J7E0_DROGR|nr:uncharacterized protein LOC6560735 [Drosophila grimshawi]EDW01064.1 GH21225 [Drosophila grimshawi]
MLTNTTQLLLLLLLSLLLLLDWRLVNGATATWGQVNKYASTLYTQDVYLTRANRTTDVAYDLQNAGASDTRYMITAVHAYDLTPQEVNGGDGGAAELINGGVGQQHATVRVLRHRAVDQLHFQLVIFGIDL